ncbi:MAG: hypothetical protein K0S18_1714, partial [Anaerocolumna sp.]|nr:hypothetical protein [Anaerocolumna sp.]
KKLEIDKENITNYNNFNTICLKGVF